METLQVEQKESNIYETFRDAIKATVYATVVKVRNTSTSFNWSVGKVISACAEACNLPITNTPADFKRIVKFEFDKLKHNIAQNSSYELKRSREDFILSDGTMLGRLTNVHTKFIELETQLLEASKMYSRLGVKMTDETLSSEKRSAIRKRMNKLVVVQDHVRAEIARQAVLVAEANQTATS
ncbi:MAG TPA: hypothetical protein VF849_00060 [Blattabacteriaceae bacterium]